MFIIWFSNLRIRFKIYKNRTSKDFFDFLFKIKHDIFKQPFKKIQAEKRENKQLPNYLSLEEARKYLEISSNRTVKVITGYAIINGNKIINSYAVTKVKFNKISKEDIDYYLKNGDDILYCPDQNLGKYAMKLSGKTFNVWPGCCPIHHFLDVKKIVELKKKNEGAKLIAHPECQPELLEYADYIGSTKQLITYAKNDSCNTFIVATEKGVLHQMKKDSPNKEFILAQNTLSCVNMKYTKLEDVYNVLNNEENEIFVDEKVSKEALKALDKMMELSK